MVDEMVDEMGGYKNCSTLGASQGFGFHLLTHVEFE
jgi:hypothetical protein